MPSDKPDKPTRYFGTTGLFAVPLADSVAKAAKPAIRKKGNVYAKLISYWDQIVGPELAQHCRFHQLSFPRDKQSEGTLTIATGSAHAPAIQHLTPLILEKIAGYLGYRAVTRIQIIQLAFPNHPENASARPASPKSTRNTQPIAAKKQITIPFAEDSPLGAALRQLQKTMINLD